MDTTNYQDPDNTNPTTGTTQYDADATPSPSKPKYKRPPKKRGSEGTPKRKSPDALAKAAKVQAARESIRAIADPVQREIAEVALVTKLFGRANTHGEATLNGIKWPGHRGLSVIEANELYAATYSEVFKEMQVRFNKDANASVPLDRQFWMNSPNDVSAIHEARRIADMLGVPYGLHLRTTMNGLFDEGWLQVPRPNQLYAAKHLARTNERIRAAMEAANLEELRSLASNPRFHADQYGGQPDQEAVLAMIRQVVEADPDRVARLREFTHVYRMVGESTARALFVDQLVDDVVSQYGPIPEGSNDVVQLPYRMVCFGFQPPEPWEPWDPCPACSLVDACRKISVAASDLLRAKTGSDDPKLARKRRLATDRKRKSR